MMWFIIGMVLRLASFTCWAAFLISLLHYGPTILSLHFLGFAAWADYASDDCERRAK